MKIAALMNVFNEEAFIREAIENIYDHVDEILVCDGAYAQFPAEKPFSTDRTLEIAREYKKVTIIETKQFWKDQLQKRTAMFQADADYFFIVDADEWVANPENIRSQIDIFKMDVGLVWQHSELYPNPYTCARILKNIPGLHHAGRHHWLFDGENNFVTSDQNTSKYNAVETNIRIFNRRNNRTQDRKEKKTQFLTNRNIEEFSYYNELDVYKKKEKLTPYPNAAGAPKKLFIDLKTGDATHSMTLMFSRDWAISPYFNNLERMSIPPNTELIVLIDTQDRQMVKKILQRLQRLKRSFSAIRYHVTKKPKLEEFSQVSHRRKRIIDNWNILLPQVRGEYIIGTEDDSLPKQPDTFIRLLSRIKSGKFDYIQADIINRWKPDFHPAWIVREENEQPIKVTTLSSGLTEEIHAVGWYCFATTFKTMASVPFVLDNTLPLGPDLRFGYSLYKKGFKLGHDFSLPCGHLTEKQLITVAGSVPTTQTWIKHEGEWKIA